MRGEITPADAADLSRPLANTAQAIEVADLEERASSRRAKTAP